MDKPNYNEILLRTDRRSSEDKQIVLSLLLALISGVIQCYVGTIPLAIFLNSFSSTMLPKVYLLVAIFSLLIGFAYNACVYKLNIKWLTSGSILVTGIILSGLALTLSQLNNKWIIEVNLIWSILALLILNFVIWSLFNAIMNIQQAQKWFGIIGGTQKIGGLIGGLASPWLISLLGVNKLFLITSVSTFTLVIISLLLWQQYDEKSQQKCEKKSEDVEEEIVKSPSLYDSYIAKIVAFMVLSIFTVYIIDLMFVSAAAEKYHNTEELSSFLALFRSLADAVDLLISFLFFSAFLKRFGLVVTLSVYPLLGLVISLLILLIFPWSAMSIIFLLILALKILVEGVKSSLTDTSSLLLFQPFSIKVRVSLNNKIDSLIASLAGVFISFVFMIITHYYGISIPLFSLVCLFCFLLSLIVLLTIKKDYINALSQALANRFYSTESQLRFAKEDLEVFKRYLESPYAHQVVCALNAIEKIDKNEFILALANLLHSNNETVKEYALEKINKYRLNSMLPTMIELLNQEKNTRFIIKLITTSAFINYTKMESLIQQFIRHQNPCISFAACIVQIKLGKRDIDDQITKNLLEICADKQVEIRRNCAEIIGELDFHLDGKLLESLINDPDKAVQEATVSSIIKCRYAPLYSQAISLLSQIEIPYGLIVDLCNTPEVFDFICQNYFLNPENKRRQILHILKEINNKKTYDLLQNIFFRETPSMKETILKILPGFQQSCSEPFSKEIQQEIIKETEEIYINYDYFIHTPVIEATQILRSVLWRKIERGVSYLFLLFTTLYDSKLLHKVRTGLQAQDVDQKSYALELLNNCLALDHKKMVIPLLKNIFLNSPENNSSIDSEKFHQVIDENIQYKDDLSINVLMVIACCYAVGEIPLPKYLPQLKELLTKNSPLLTETILMILQKKGFVGS